MLGNHENIVHKSNLNSPTVNVIAMKDENFVLYEYVVESFYFFPL